jgi:hypothetical protein
MHAELAPCNRHSLPQSGHIVVWAQPRFGVLGGLRQARGSSTPVAVRMWRTSRRVSAAPVQNMAWVGDGYSPKRAGTDCGTSRWCEVRGRGAGLAEPSGSMPIDGTGRALVVAGRGAGAMAKVVTCAPWFCCGCQ